jgi:hypothetical protein
MKWHPIKTAPKDGSQIFLGGGNLYRATVGEWFHRQTLRNGKIVYSDSGWQIHAMSIGFYKPEPKFWMPIPPLPKSRKR